MWHWGRLHSFESASWISLVVLAWAVVCPASLGARAQARRRSILPWLTLLPPTAALLATWIDFGVRGGFPAVRMSDRAAFLGWGRAWPMLLLLQLAGAALAVVGTIAGGSRRTPSLDAKSGTWLVVALANGVSLGAVVANFPST